jgi:pimeloyl-ACP methyl ester carboxylesterase
VTFEGDDRPPPGWKRFKEVAWLMPRFFRSFGHLGPRGPIDGPPALVIPGFIATDRTTLQLRRALARQGWRVHGWGLGLNKGAHGELLRHLARRLDSISDERPVLLVGWSLGGLFARELAREVPHRVRAVVTLGSPFSGDPRMNNVWRLYEMVAGHKVDDPPIPHHSNKPPPPTLAIWSPEDGIVAPRAARGLDSSERDEVAEVRCTHMAFGISHRATVQVVHEIGQFLERTGA